MAQIGIPEFKDATVHIEVSSRGESAAVLQFTGVLGHRDPGPILQPIFAALHRAVVEQKRSVVNVDFRALRFMNSSSFKYFIGWVKENGALSPEARYKIHFLLNPNNHWQEVSIHALSCFSMDAITVEKSSA